MKKVNFTQDFYKKVYNALCEYCKEYYEGDKNCMSVSTITVDGYEIECDADVDTEWRDDSFDHAFGTWHDKYSDLRRIVKGGPQPTHKIDLVHALLDALYGFDLAEGRVSE